MTPICTLKNLTLTFPHKNIFRDVQLTLNKGDKIGVLGLNGHGKSSLFQVLMGSQTPDTTVPPFQYDKSREFSIFLVPQELPRLKGITLENYFYEFHPVLKDLRKQLEHVESQLTEDPSDALLEKQFALYEKLGAEDEDRIHNQYLSYLKYFGLDDHSITLDNLSGGEQRKIALSLGLSAPQNIILWDEPTNHLDLETIELFEDELMGASNKTYMLISHDRTLLNNVTDRILHIQQGSLLSFSGSYEEYLLHLQEQSALREQEITKLSNTKRRETAWMRRGVSARRTRSKKRVESYHNLSDEITKLKALAHRKTTLSLKASGRKTKRLIMAEELTKSFDDKTLFKGINFEICKGDKIALLGQNGVGKSTLINIICGTEKANSGKMDKAHQLDIGFFSQRRESLKEEMSPWELIGEGTDYVISNTGDRKHVASYLENYLFRSEELKRPISTFSGGEKNRLQLAQFMKDARDIWIFDEPTNDLDLETIGILEEELKNYKGAVLVICHDRNFIENVANSCWVIHDQKLEMFDGGLEQAKAYLDATILEKKLSLLDAPEKTEPVVEAPKKPARQASYKEKLRYDEVQKLIEETENKIVEIENILAKFEYSTMDAGQEELINQLQEKLTQENTQLERYIEEWGKLEEIIEST